MNMTISYIANFKWDVVIHTAEALNQELDKKKINKILFRNYHPELM